MKLKRIYFVLPESYFERQKTLSVNSSGPHFKHSGRAPNEPHTFLGTEADVTLFQRVMKRYGIEIVPAPGATEVEVSLPGAVKSVDELPADAPTSPDEAPSVQHAGPKGDLQPHGEQSSEGAAGVSALDGDAKGRGAGEPADAGRGPGRPSGAVESKQAALDAKIAADKAAGRDDPATLASHERMQQTIDKAASRGEGPQVIYDPASDPFNIRNKPAGMSAKAWRKKKAEALSASRGSVPLGTGTGLPPEKDDNIVL